MSVLMVHGAAITTLTYVGHVAKATTMRCCVIQVLVLGSSPEVFPSCNRIINEDPPDVLNFNTRLH